MDKRVNHNRTGRYIISFAVLGVLVVLFFILSVKIGSIEVSWKDVFSSFGGEKGVKQKIIMDIRLPRTIAALLMGGALGISGFMLQSFFNNPIAGPFVLGISSGVMEPSG